MQRAPFPRAFAAASFAALLCAVTPAARAAEPNVRLPAPKADLAARAGTRSVVLAGGCFWGLQGMFEHVKGVTRVVAGYAGGDAATAHYRIVSSGETGHAESVKIDYDPAVVSYGQLLQLFFSTAHDASQVGGQGPDEGSQYRSTIFVADAAERRVAAGYIAELGATALIHGPITTTLEPLRRFYPAEGSHQDYLIHHPDSPYIVTNDAPKIAALQRIYPELYRDKPVVLASD
ncbi:peptide-methionine (S)-S-oxide reductase [Lichenibacterium minor]|uniref:Peptide methionine sulfoxide reductase MsrA n=1 Tax=Lichenibacterium minor TaxID=2316528 RepID=A0A4Q2UAA6_9HYPH|nr:peptide-methionine (S)-S-oxide reductase MsrA [Lichenibacterium minor]RYC31825.1 peptide-methionine (S)-S-oxide reductase [Lichenibacterium minor]